MSGSCDSHHVLSNLQEVRLRGCVLAKELIDFDLGKQTDLVRLPLCEHTIHFAALFQLKLMQEQYTVGQLVSAVVLSIDWRLNQLNLSFRTAQSDRAVGAMTHGVIQNELPSKKSSLIETGRLEAQVGGWILALEKSRIFHNRAALADMVKQMAVLEHHSVVCGTHTITEDYEQLRQVQNKGWAHQSVKR